MIMKKVRFQTIDTPPFDSYRVRRILASICVILPAVYLVHIILLHTYGRILQIPDELLLPEAPAPHVFIDSNSQEQEQEQQHTFAHFSPPNETERPNAYHDTFAEYTGAKRCKVSSLDLHLPFSPLCSTRQELLHAMSYGGRAGIDTPYIPLGCDMRWYTTEEACAILSRFSHIFILGDSLQRHLTNSLYTILRADIASGAITDWALKDPQRFMPGRVGKEKDGVPQDCNCRRNIEVHGCSDLVIRDSKWLKGNASETFMCPLGNGLDFDMTYHVLLKHPVSQDVLERMTDDYIKDNGGRDVVPAKPPVFIMGHCLWDDVKVEKTQKWINQVTNHIKQALPWLDGEKAFFPRLFMSANTGGVTRALGLEVAQTRTAIANFERKMESWVHDRGKGLEFLGFWNMSVQTSQQDAAHSNFETNLVKAQMVLNWLDKVEVDRHHGTVKGEEVEEEEDVAFR